MPPRSSRNLPYAKVTSPEDPPLRFSAFALEVMLGHPETVVAKAIHERGHGLGLAQRSCKVRVRVTPLVDGRSAITDVVEVGMTGIEAVKLGDHREFSVPYQPGPDCRISNWQWSVSGLLQRIMAKGFA